MLVKNPGIGRIKNEKNMFSTRLYCCLFLLIISVILNGCALFRPAPDKLFKRALKNEPYDVIIVPGLPFNGEKWSPIMKDRVNWACYLLENGIAKNVIFSGGAVYTPYVEAKVMALYAEAMGIPKDKIFIEMQAQHSTENVYNSYCMAKKIGFTKIAIATNRFQSDFLMGFTKRKFKLTITHIPIVAELFPRIDCEAFHINADSAKVENFKSIIETQSKWHRFRGTQGKNINFEME